MIMALFAFLYPAADNRDSAMAQEPATVAPLTTGSASDNSNPYDEVPDAYIEEADAVFEECTQTPRINRYYNCACLSVRFLDTRIERGTSASKSSIMLGLREECKDATEAAGNEYNQCMGMVPMLPLDVEPETYCECVANTFSTILEQSPVVPGAQTFYHVRTRAMLTCQNQ